MNISPIEKKIRAGLPLVRFMQTTIPLRVAGWLNRQGLTRARMPAGIRREAVSADGVPCDWVIPENGREDRVLLYLHGGGFVFGQTALHLEMGAYLAGKLGMRLLMVDYRLAPEHPFPAAVEDCVTAYRWLLKEGIAAQHIGVAGDSAGGNLTLTLMLKLRQDGTSLPASAACLSPVTDLAEDKQRPGFKDPLLPPKATRFYSRAYIGGHEARDPLISPVFGDLRGLPPLLVHAGEDEILRQDAVRITELARSAGVDVRLEIYPRMWHVWQLFMALPQAKQSLEDIAEFFEARL